MAEEEGKPQFLRIYVQGGGCSGLSYGMGFLKEKNVIIPIVVVLDLHANVSEKMTKNSTCLFAYRKNPHSDSREIGRASCRERV